MMMLSENDSYCMDECEPDHPQFAEMVAHIADLVLTDDATNDSACSSDNIVGENNTQLSYRELQRCIDTETDNITRGMIVTDIINSYKGQLGFVMLDNVGQFLVPRLVRCCTAIQRTAIINELRPQMINYICTSNGSHAIQSCLRCINKWHGDELVGTLLGHVAKIATNFKGSYVIRTLAKTNIRGPNTTALVNELSANCLKICCTKIGQTTYVSWMTTSRIDDNVPLTYALVANMQGLIENRHGSTILRLFLGMEHFTSIHPMLLATLTSKLPRWSTHRFSSSVVEACLDITDKISVAYLIDQFLNQSVLSVIAPNIYGNYIVQHIALKCTPTQRQILNMMLKELSQTASSLCVNYVCRKLTCS